MKKTSLILLLLTSSIFAGNLETQAEAMGSARAISLYWGEHIKSLQAAQSSCEEYSKKTYSDASLQNICINACVSNFKSIISKNER